MTKTKTDLAARNLRVSVLLHRLAQVRCELLLTDLTFAERQRAWVQLLEIHRSLDNMAARNL